MLLTFCTIANSSTLSKVIFCHVNVWRLTSLRLVFPCSCLIYKKLKKAFQNFTKYPDNIQRSFQWCTLSVLCCNYSYSAVLFHSLHYLSVRRCTFSHSAVPLYSVVPFCTVRLPLQPTTPHWETLSMAVRAISLPVCHRRTAQGLPNWIQTMFGRAVFYSTISIDDINAQNGWSLKTEKFRLRHLFLTWTSL